jgi:hypothetical protein
MRNHGLLLFNTKTFGGYYKEIVSSEWFYDSIQFFRKRIALHGNPEAYRLYTKGCSFVRAFFDKSHVRRRSWARQFHHQTRMFSLNEFWD